MIRLLLNADAPPSMAPVTRFGGLPLIPGDSNFQWPRCSGCGVHMQFLGQIALEDHDAKRLVLLFMCQNDPGSCDDWNANSGGNRAMVVMPDRAPSLAEIPQDGLAVRETAHGAHLEEVDSESYGDARKQWAQRNNCSPLQILGQFDGEPSWIQADETPTCDICGKRMQFLAQLEEGPDYKTAMNFGGGGCAYVFRCSCTQHTAKFLWQCS